MKEEMSLSLTLEPGQIYSFVSNIMNECREGGIPYKSTPK